MIRCWVFSEYILDPFCPKHHLVVFGEFGRSMVFEVVLEVVIIEEFPVPLVDEPVDSCSGDIQKLSVVFDYKLTIISLTIEVVSSQFLIGLGR